MRSRIRWRAISGIERGGKISLAAAPHPTLSPYAHATGRGGPNRALLTSGAHALSSSPRRSHCCERGEGRVRGGDTHRHIVARIQPATLGNGCVPVGASGARPSSFLHRGAKRGERHSPLRDNAAFIISETIARKVIPAPKHGLILTSALPPRDRNARWWIGSGEHRGCRT